MSSSSSSLTNHIASLVERGNVLLLAEFEPFLAAESASAWARELLRRAAAAGHGQVILFLVRQCGVDPNDHDDADTWPCLEAAIGSNEPSAVRLLLEVADRRPAVSDFWAAVPHYGEHDNSEIVQLLLDHGACDDPDELHAAAERACNRGCDFRDYFELSWADHQLEKHEDPRAIAHWFIVDIIECHRARVERRSSFVGQRDAYATAIIAIAPLELPALLAMAIVDEARDWRLDTHTRWLVAHRTQQKARTSVLFE